MSQLAPQPRFPAAKFQNIGDSFSGKVVYPPEDRQARKFGSSELAFWPDGQPKMQTKIVLNLADIGEDCVAVYVQGRMVSAVRKALAEAGAPDIEVGGVLSVTLTATEPSKGGGQPVKLYEAAYTAPAPFDPADVVGTEPPF